MNRHALTVKLIIEAETRDDAKDYVRRAFETWDDIAFDYDESGHTFVLVKFVSPRPQEPILDKRNPADMFR